MSMSRCRGSTFPPQSMSTPTIAPRWLFPPMVGTIVCLVVSWLCRVKKKKKKTFSCWLFTLAKIPLGKLMLWVEWPVTRVGYQAGWQHGWIRREAGLWRGGGYYFESHSQRIMDIYSPVDILYIITGGCWKLLLWKTQSKVLLEKQAWENTSKVKREIWKWFKFSKMMYLCFWVIDSICKYRAWQWLPGKLSEDKKMLLEYISCES